MSVTDSVMSQPALGGKWRAAPGRCTRTFLPGARRSDGGKVARLTGLEPATPGVTGRYSNQLSYNRA